MKKLVSLALISTLVLSGTAIAKHHPQSGFKDGTPRIEQGFQGGLISATTVEQAKKSSDDAWVVLRGNITKQVGKKEYLFKDSTGEIQIEVNNRNWRGQTVTPNDLVEISGKVDKDWNSIEIEVKEVKLITQQTPAK